jgi:hypothetical protein
MNHFSFQACTRSVLLLLAAVLIVAALAVATTSRGASSTSASCTATSLELVGTSGMPSAGVPVIDLTGDYEDAEDSISTLDTPQTISVLMPLNFEKITVAISGCAIDYDGTAQSVAISGTATNILPGGDPQETADLLVLATWQDEFPTVSLGGHVNGDFDLARIHEAFQAPEGLKPEFSEVWFTQSNGEQTDPGSYAGAGDFYPSGHVIPAGVAFRGELALASIIGDVLAGYLGNPTVSILGGVPVEGEVTIYNDTLVVQSEFTLQGQIDLSGVNGLPAGISFPSNPPWTLTLTLKPTATNDRGNLNTFGIQAGITGSMEIDKALLGTSNNLVLDMLANFEWDSASESVVVDLAVTAQGSWNNLFGMTGFSADSVTVALRASTKPNAQAASIRVTGVFTANGFQFALTFRVSEKDNKFSAKVTAESLSDITVPQLIGALANLDQLNEVNMDQDSSWSVLQGITLTRLKAAVSFGQAGASVFVTADAEVYGLQTSVAFYLGPDKQPASEGGQPSGETKYGFLFAVYVDSVDIGDLVSELPDFLDITLPQTIFYVSSLKFDADIYGFPDPDLFRFINQVYGTTEDPGAKIALEAGAGLLSNVCAPPIPQGLQDMLEKTLWMDFSGCLAFQGNVPLFGKTGVSLFLYLPEVKPKEEDRAPEWFERALLHLSIGVDQSEAYFKLQGELDIRLRKPGAPDPANLEEINLHPERYDHFQFLASGLVEIKTTPPTVDVTLTGEFQAPGGWHPLGWEALTIEQLALVLNVGTTPEGNAKIGLGLGAAIVLGTGQDRLDLEASFLVGVQTLQVFPWVTANIDGFRFQTTRGLKSADLITLADAFSTSLPQALQFPQDVKDAVVANLPNIAIRDVEISFAKVDNEPLCLRVGFTIKGSLYVNPTTDPPYVQRQPCDPGPPPPCVKEEGCFGAVDIEAVLTAAQPPKIKGKLDLNAFDIGPYIHIGPANVDLEISQAAVHLIVHGQMSIDGVGSGLVDLKITPNSYELTAEAKLFNAFWAYLDANMTIVPPTYQAHGELKAEFGTAMASALEGETRNLRALLATLGQLYADFQDPNKDLDDLTDSLLNLGNTLKANGAQGPLIDLMVLFSEQLVKWKAEAEKLGMYPSLDQVVNVILNGAWITITGGTPGYWVYPECIGVYWKGKCYGVWIPSKTTCVTYYDGSTCWLIPPIKFHIPGICPGIINLDAYGGCNSTGLKNLAAKAVDDAFYQIFGVHISTVLDELASAELPVLFDVNCAAFDIDLGVQADNTIDLFLGITLLGKPVVWEGTWDFDASLAQNIGDNRTFLINFIKNILAGQTPNVYEKCTHTAPGPPPGGKSGTPTDLTVTALAQVSEGQAFTLHGAFAEEGVRQGDVRTYTITWGDGNTTTAALSWGQTSFDVAHTYADDPVGNNDNRQIAVTVTNARAGSASTSRTIKVVNVNPTAGTPQLSAASVWEGEVVTVTGSFSDPGWVGYDTHTVLVTWNDGSQPTAAVVNQQSRTYTAQHMYLDDNPTATTQDTVGILVQITDDDGGKAQTQTSLVVKNVAPQLTSLGVTPLPSPQGVSAMAEEPGGEFFEGDQFLVEGEFSDPGSLDTHSVKIEWKATDTQGDWQVFSQTGVEFSERSFSITLPLPDDDPTATPEDPVTIRVTVEDDDLGTFSQEFPIILKNRDPEDVTVTVDSESIEEDDTVGVTVEWTDAGLADTHVILIDWDDGNQTVLDTLEVGEREAYASHHYRDDAKTSNPVDTYEITATVIDDDTGSGAGSAILTVNDVPPVVSVDTGSQSVQYSDPITDVTVMATDVETDPLSATTSWASGAVAPTGDLANAGLPDWLTLSADGNCVTDSDANLRTCAWTLSPQLSGVGVHSDAAPGLYTVRVKITDDDTLFATVDTVIAILPEDAIAYYVGPTFASTVSARNGSADIELRANVRDITTALPGPDAPWDPYPGDIRNATVTFVDAEKSPGDAGYELCSAPVDAIFIVGGQPDTNIGTAECVWHADIGIADAVPFHIGVVVGGRYTNDLFPEQTVVTVAKPLDNFITGGGYLVLEASEGAYAGDDGSKANFGFNVKFNNSDTNLHGRATLLFRIGDRTYKIKSNAIESLGVVDPTGEPPRTAQFEAKANLTDVTDPDNPIGLGGNLSLQMMMTDWGEPGAADTISFTLWESKIGREQRLLFSSAWDGNRTVEQQLAGGNLMVHGNGSAAGKAPLYPYRGDDICDSVDDDGDTVIDEGWNLKGGPIADCLDPALDTDGDTVTNAADDDDDGDGWSDAAEGFMRTDPLNACPLDAYHDAWPPDINNDASANILDLLRYKPIVAGLYDRRYDLNVDGEGNILDVLLYKWELGKSCTNS